MAYLAAAGNVRLALYDGMGRVIRTTTIAGAAGRNNYSLATTGINPGIYFYKLDAAGTGLTGKVALVK